jgi:uncharacterized protein YjiS (DUF1127 family)
MSIRFHDSAAPTICVAATGGRRCRCASRIFSPGNVKEAAMTVIELTLPARRQQIAARVDAERPGFGLRQVAALIAARWRSARKLRQARRYVMAMDERTLADIGVSRAQALFEIDRAGRGGG